MVIASRSSYFLEYALKWRSETMWAALAKAKIDIQLQHYIVAENEGITITKGKEEKYALWNNDGIYDLQEKYVKDIKVISKD